VDCRTGIRKFWRVGRQTFGGGHRRDAEEGGGLAAGDGEDGVHGPLELEVVGDIDRLGNWAGGADTEVQNFARNINPARLVCHCFAQAFVRVRRRKPERVGLAFDAFHV